MTISEWADLMTSKIVVRHALSTAGKSAFGVPTYSTKGSTYAMHWKQGQASRRYSDGIEQGVTSMAWLASTSTSNVGRHDLFQLPDGSRPPCLKVVYERDETGGVHHTVVVFG